MWKKDRRWRCVGGILLRLRGGEGCFLVHDPLFRKVDLDGILRIGEWVDRFRQGKNQVQERFKISLIAGPEMVMESF